MGLRAGKLAAAGVTAGGQPAGRSPPAAATRGAGWSPPPDATRPSDGPVALSSETGAPAVAGGRARRGWAGGAVG